MMAKPIRALELLYPMIQFLIITNCLTSNHGGSVRVRVLWDKQHYIHMVRKTKERFTKSKRFVFIGPILKEMQRIIIPKFTKK